MKYHILNGDALAYNFNIEGEKIICRECLIEGEKDAENWADFWEQRAEFIEKTYNIEDYFVKVKTEIDKLEKFKPVDELNFWFGDDAFCQVNLWFLLSLIADLEIVCYRIFPDSEGWDCAYKDLQKCFENRQKMSADDLLLAKKLWQAFSKNDFEKLKKLGITQTKVFPKLEEVCDALAAIESRPKETLSIIKSAGEIDFGKIFAQFKEKAGVYGFGDSQVKNISSHI